MSKMYIIQWKSKINGRAGKGTKQFEQEEAERLVRELNQEYPQIHHEAVGAEPQPDTASVTGQPEGEELPATDPTPAVSVE